MRRWYGQFFGFIAGWLLLKHPVGGLLGLLVGYAFDHDWFSAPRRAEKRKSRPQQQAESTGNADVGWSLTPPTQEDGLKNWQEQNPDAEVSFGN